MRGGVRGVASAVAKLRDISRTSSETSRRKERGERQSRIRESDYSILVSVASLVLAVHFSILMNGIPVWMYLQKEPVVCPQCGSTARIARDLCLRCMLSVGLDASGDTSETLDDLLSDIDLQDAECPASQLSSSEEIEPVNYGKQSRTISRNPDGVWAEFQPSILAANDLDCRRTSRRRKAFRRACG
jgi:hypothetical protein